jgi:CBS domain containing-hemolysin-like protein
MLGDYHPLALTVLPPLIGYAQPSQHTPDHVTLNDAAVGVMTDLERVTAVIVLPGDSIDEANRRMIQRGVRLLLVVDQDRKVQGVLTATDVLGEKPVQVVVARSIRRDEVQVRDVMTPLGQMQAIDLNQVLASRVGHIVATLRQAGRQHALVTDRDAKGGVRLRGIFSATQIARQLGLSISTGAIASTFADIEAQLAR